MKVILLRHAKAHTGAGYGSDLARTLNAEGIRQARRLAEALGPESPTELFSSPALRCLATVEPLGLRMGLAPSEDDRLCEHVKDDDLIAFGTMAVASPGTVVACGHAPTLVRLAREITGVQEVSVASSELQLGVASFLVFEFSDQFGRRLEALTRCQAPEYHPGRLFG